jgi:hypothetical protein
VTRKLSEVITLRFSLLNFNYDRPKFKTIIWNVEGLMMRNDLAKLYKKWLGDFGKLGKQSK